jgi:formate hydrogenlyase subunit 6/NADH:ubiquinone oxidoreductase subunit I
VTTKRGYFGAVVEAARTTAEGLSITLAQYFRRPTTVQYPDRTPVPVRETLPSRYRGFLEVDLATCTACKACERDCPIDVIRIDVEKRDEGRVMSRFDIDLGKCMYCGICVESCPVEVRAEGEDEPQKCIRFTREFEGATTQFSSLTFRFIAPGEAVAPYKPPKKAEATELPPSPARGTIARRARADAQRENPAAFAAALAQTLADHDGSLARVLDDEVVHARARELAARLDGDFPSVIKSEALARTDCESCGYPSCADYAQAIARGADAQTWKCLPGAARATRDVELLVQLRRGASPERAAAAAANLVRLHHRADGTPKTAETAVALPSPIGNRGWESGVTLRGHRPAKSRGNLTPLRFRIAPASIRLPDTTENATPSKTRAATRTWAPRE